MSSKWPRRLISNIDDSAQIWTERTNRRQRLETVSGGFVFFSSPGLTLMPGSVRQIARLEQDLLSREIVEPPQYGKRHTEHHSEDRCRRAAGTAGEDRAE